MIPFVVTKGVYLILFLFIPGQILNRQEPNCTSLSTAKFLISGMFTISRLIGFSQFMVRIHSIYPANNYKFPRRILYDPSTISRLVNWKKSSLPMYGVLNIRTFFTPYPQRCFIYFLYIVKSDLVRYFMYSNS